MSSPLPERPTDREVRAAQRQVRGGAKGSPFDILDGARLFGAYNGGAALDATFDVRGVDRMLAVDPSAARNAQILGQPFRSAQWEIKDAPDGKREGDHARDVLGRLMGGVKDRCSNAIWHRKAFHELLWEPDGSGWTIADMAWRPPTSCEQKLLKSGQGDGFLQRVPHDHPDASNSAHWGKTHIEALRSFVYVHGRHRDPVHGYSDLQITHALFDQRRKLTFLLLQFLELQAVPRVLAYGRGEDAGRNADMLVAAMGGGVVPWETDGGGDPGAKAFDVLESAGNNSGLFLETLRYLEAQGTQSILADFTQLADQAASGKGSYAMVSDLRRWFEDNLQAKADEWAEQVTAQVLRPLTILNYGPDAPVPSMSVGPVSTTTAETGLDMLKTTITAPTVNAPPGAVDALWLQSARLLGIDVDEMRDVVKTWRAEAQTVEDDDQDEASRNEAVELSHTIDTVYGIVTDALDGTAPDDALRERLGAVPPSVTPR